MGARQVALSHGAEGARQLAALGVVEGRAEVEHRRQDVTGLEVSLAAVEVHEPAGHEATFLEEHEANPPGPALDALLAAPALGLAARRTLGPVDPRQPP